MKKPAIIIALILFIGLAQSRPVDAGLIVYLNDNLNGTVDYTITGSIKSPPLGTPTSTNNPVPSAGSVSPAAGSLLILGDTTAYDVYQVNILGSYQPFGTGALQATTGLSSGDLFGFFPNGGTADVWLPTGYSAGNALSATGQWNGSLASLGLEVGNYLTTIELSNSLGFDTVAVNISEAPEPSTVMILGSMSLGFLGCGRRRKPE